ncbi:MAG: thioredoxin domain-containing protein [Ignavibacteriae bacterium]|nr:thioredoxin domain-containing protein [Ignavibacteriota bacterium]
MSDLKPNKLINEKSPYLLQHAYNPVNWNAWNNETLQLAKELDKPIFLSIGYSTCYWCHVMERECFENQEIAELLNDTFVNIKVDREERPDIDRIYMSALQSISGSGGWPMSMFLTPDLKPFYGATYIPPKAKYGRSGFEDVINQIKELWKNQRTDIINSSLKITEVLSNTASQSDSDLNEEVFSDAYNYSTQLYDEEQGGFGSGNKFPRPVLLDFLLTYYHSTKDKSALDIVTYTLKKMHDGGIFDNIDKGFHRYSVDKYWRVPHFEKMLYDQAQVANTYFDAYSITKTNYFKSAACDTLDYVKNFLLDEKGGFYSAEDAESAISKDDLTKKQEGYFYIWQRDDIFKLLGTTNAEIFCACFGIMHKGNTIADPHNIFGTSNVLYKTNDIFDIAKKFETTPENIDVILKESIALLKIERDKRPRPFLDKKILTTWNSLIISAFVKGYMVTENEEYKKLAVRAVSFVIYNLYNDKEEKLYHRYIDGEVMFDATLEDYAFLIKALLDFHNISFSGKLLALARKLTDKAIIDFYDESNGGFFDTGKDREDVILRTKDIYDGAEPSGNSVMLDNLNRLFIIYKDDKYFSIAEKGFKFFYQKVSENPFSSPFYLNALFNFLKYNTSIILSGDLRSDLFNVFHSEIKKKYFPNKNLIYYNNVSAKMIPYLNDIVTELDKNKVYVCQNFACNLPVATKEELTNLLNNL